MGLLRMTVPAALRRPEVALAAVLALTMLLRVPSLFEPPWYDDEGIYAAVAHGMVNGRDLYSEILDNRPPGIYFIYGLLLAWSGFAPWMIKLGAALAVLAGQVGIFAIGRRMWGAPAGLLAAALAGLALSLPFLEGNIANSEVFMLAPLAFGMLAVLRGRYLAAGLCFGAAFLIKQIAGLELLAAALAILFWTPQPRLALARLVIGFLVPVAAATVWLAATGVLGEFIAQGFGYYIGYVQRGTRVAATPGFIALRAALFATAVALIWRSVGRGRTPEHLARGLPWLWLSAALYGAFFTARPYPHYLLEALPPLALAVAPWLTVYRGREVAGWSGGRLVSAFGLAGATVWIFVVIYMPWPSWAHPERTPAYYSNFLAWKLGAQTEGQYNDFFDRRVNRNLRIVSYLKEHAAPGTFVLVWGEEPWIYPLANVLNPARFSVSYFAYEVPTGLDEVAQTVSTRKPRFVVWTKNKPLYPTLQAALDRNYRLVASVDNADILERQAPDLATERLAGNAAAIPSARD